MQRQILVGNLSAVWLAPDGGRAVVLRGIRGVFMSFRGELSVVDLTTGSVTDLDDVELDELSFVLAVTPDGRRVYIVCNPRPRVTVVDLGGL